MRIATAWQISAAVFALSGCSGNGVSAPGNQLPAASQRIAALGVAAPDIVKSGIYVAEFYGPTIMGYRKPNRKNEPPICYVNGVSDVNGIAVDGGGNLIVPDGGSKSIIVFRGPQMCGKELARVSDPYGQPADAASNDAKNGEIVVANETDDGGPGSVTVCTLDAGCTKNLRNSNVYEVVAVALAKNGDCWASTIATSRTAVLLYFKNCSGSGKTAANYQNTNPGGLDIDNEGNLVSVSYLDQKLYVYHGCNPSCKLVGGPFALQGLPYYGRVDKKSTSLVTGDAEFEQVNVYSYRPTRLTYEYSFDNGLGPSNDVEGVAFNPRSSE